MADKIKVSLKFRFSGRVHDRLKAASELSGRSLNGEILHRLEVSFARDEWEAEKTKQPMRVVA